MKANQDKCHFLSSLDITTELLLCNSSVENSSSKKLLGVIIERKLKFNEYITNLCSEASKENQVPARIFPYMPVTPKTRKL